MSQPEDLESSSAGRPEKSGGNGCLKALLIVGVIGGVCVLVCCGVGTWFAFQFKPQIVQTPAEVAAMAQEIADIDVGAEFTGAQGMALDNFLMSMRMCVFHQKDGKGFLQLTEMQVKFGDPQQQEAQLKAQMQSQGAGVEMKTINAEKTETRTFTIRGQEVAFTFTEGQDVSSTTRYHQVRGQFTGKHGPASLALQLEDEVWDEEEVDRLLKSIK